MNARITQAATSTKNFIKRNQFALGFAVAFTLCGMAHIKIIRNVNEFLEEHGLLDEMYHLDEED